MVWFDDGCYIGAFAEVFDFGGDDSGTGCVYECSPFIGSFDGDEIDGALVGAEGEDSEDAVENAEVEGYGFGP